MTIKDLYNALEKAIDSGEATLENQVYLEEYNNDLYSIEGCYVDSDGDLILKAE